MKNLNFKHATIYSIMIYTLGVGAFIGSFYVPILTDPNLQANLALIFVLLPGASLGAHLYYRMGNQTNGFLLGVYMFLIAGILDALITVPVFVMPLGGNHLTFFTDPGFWLIAVLYVAVVAITWFVRKKSNKGSIV